MDATTLFPYHILLNAILSDTPSPSATTSSNNSIRFPLREQRLLQSIEEEFTIEDSISLFLLCLQFVKLFAAGVVRISHPITEQNRLVNNGDSINYPEIPTTGELGTELGNDISEHCDTKNRQNLEANQFSINNSEMSQQLGTTFGNQLVLKTVLLIEIFGTNIDNEDKSLSTSKTEIKKLQEAIFNDSATIR